MKLSANNRNYINNNTRRETEKCQWKDDINNTAVWLWLLLLLFEVLQNFIISFTYRILSKEAQFCWGGGGGGGGWGHVIVVPPRAFRLSIHNIYMNRSLQ